MQSPSAFEYHSWHWFKKIKPCVSMRAAQLLTITKRETGVKVEADLFISRRKDPGILGWLREVGAAVVDNRNEVY